SVTLGENTQVGQMAFYNCASLENIDFTKVQTIGDMAFAGSSLQYCLENNQWQYAYNRVYVNGEVIIVDYMYSSFAPKFASADLSNVQEIGNGAFMNNKQLATVTLNQNATAISAQAFANCSSLSNVTLPQTVAQVGEYAFYATALTSIDLTNVDTVGEGAFARTNLTQITLKDGAALQTGAFRYCFNLTEANGLEKVTEIGAQAFANTALTTADLQNAAVIGDFAFANSQLTEVKFGNLLVEVGENPFLNCEIQSYGKQTEITFNGEVIGYETQENYQISESVQVIDGVLYSTVPNGGLQLASYPMASDKVAYEVQNGTVRISANAFVGAKLATVTLPISLKAIGDKAFYQCENLSMVVFTSYYAPTLEEQYDQTYLTYLNMPLSGKLGEYEGLGISKYYMWNITSNYTNFYFGANFVDYISHIEKGIVMVKPTNGENYETFIMDQYFATVVSGSSAATEATLKVIQLINDLPANITLANEAQVVEARAAYNAIPTLEQQALVSNYAQLTSAEGTIIYLKLREEEGKEPELPPVIDQPEQPNAFVTFLKDNYVGIIIAGVAILALAGYITFDLIKKKKSKGDNVQD
ncbi:MAG: leucine-rich repeat protein, partial [Clostridia bacterium]|nr:leucine-rich repeat protein [Clostridia bacterium]